MIGKGGVITKMLSDKTDSSNIEMATLRMIGKNDQATNVAFQGPGYFLDVVIENFETGLEITSEEPKS